MSRSLHASQLSSAPFVGLQIVHRLHRCLHRATCCTCSASCRHTQVAHVFFPNHQTMLMASMPASATLFLRCAFRSSLLGKMQLKA